MKVQSITCGTVLLFLCCMVVAKPGVVSVVDVRSSGRDRQGTDKVEEKLEQNLKYEGIPSDPDDKDEDEKPPPKADDDRKREQSVEFARDLTKKMTDVPVSSLGVNMNLLLDTSVDMYDNTPRKNNFRDGFATDTDSCQDIRSVPKELRDPAVFFNPVNEFYQKYTEAYGIPILGSALVTDEGLRRACYEVKFLLAHRYDVRNAYFQCYGRVALIADSEQQTSLFEYKFWDSSYWDNRARGLSPTITIPLTSAGDDNQRCKPGEKYSKQDILVHEFCHAIHFMGAVFVIEGFQRRLLTAYNNAMNEGHYSGEYAATNQNEYFAVGCQIYFDSLQTKGITFLNQEGETVVVSNRHTLKTYDPALVSLLDEVFPCPNNFVHRCTWKECNLANFEFVYDRTQVVVKSQCKVLKSSYKEQDAEACAEYTCYHLGNAFNYKKTAKAMYCYALHCDDLTDLQLTQSSGAFDVYRIKAIPQMDLTAENSKPMQTMCTSNVEDVLIDKTTKKSKRCSIDTGKRVKYGPTPTKDNKGTCQSRGGCFESGYGCYFPTQESSDHGVSCMTWATQGDVDQCLANPVTMLDLCPLSCHAAKWAYRVQQNLDQAQSLCHDYFPDCQDPDCTKYKDNKCRLHCKSCNLESNWKSVMGAPDLDITPMKK